MERAGVAPADLRRPRAVRARASRVRRERPRRGRGARAAARGRARRRRRRAKAAGGAGATRSARSSSSSGRARVTTSTRKNFERVYDLTERVLPPAIIAAPTPRVDDAHRELVRLSARALGIATDDDLADYFRLRLGDVRPRIAELVEEGALAPVRIEGIAKPAYLACRCHGAARRDRARHALAVRSARLAPRAHASPLRLPLSHRDLHARAPARRTATTCCRSSTATRSPRASTSRPRATRARCSSRRCISSRAPTQRRPRPRSPAELRDVASWLGLERITVTRKGSLAKALAKELPR